METIMYVCLVFSSTMRTPYARHHARQKTSANADLHSAPHVHMGIHRHAWIVEQRIDTCPHSHVLRTNNLTPHNHAFSYATQNPATPQNVARRVERGARGLDYWVGAGSGSLSA